MMVLIPERPLPKRPDRLQTVEPGHVYVNDRDVRFQNAALAQGLFPIRSLAHDLEPRALSDDIAQPTPQERMVIHDQH